jgi:hypothetical protein
MSRGISIGLALVAALGAATSTAQAEELDRITGVSVAPETLGPLAITIKDRAARAGIAEGGEYAVYRLTYTNRGEKTFQFVNNRSSSFYGADDGLLLADDGCGFGFSPGEDVDAGVCQAYLDFIKLRPGESATRTITAWTGLQGMGQLEAGDFTHTREVKLTRRGEIKRTGTLGFTFSVGS